MRFHAISRSPLKLLGGLLLASALTACTGTDATGGNSSLQLVLLTDGGQALRTYDLSSSGTAALSDPIAVDAGRDLLTTGTGETFFLARTGGLDRRTVALSDAVNFVAPPFDPCFIKVALNVERTRIAALSQCVNDANQYIALYSTDGSLIWSAPLPAFVKTAVSDAPPLALAAVGDVATVSRPALGGGSEVIRVAPRGSGDAVLDRVAVVSDPQPTPPIRDLASFRGAVYAATDSGVYPLLPTGLPNTDAPVSALGKGRFDRLWEGSVGSDRLLMAWRDTALSNSSEPLRAWNGTATEASTVASLTNIRDVTLGPDGNLYVLVPGLLLRYDAILGLKTGNWQSTTLLSNTALNDARSVIWLLR